MLTNNFNQTFDNSKEYLPMHLLMETSLLITSVIKKSSLQMLAKLYDLKFLFCDQYQIYLPARFENALFFDDGTV